MHRIPTTLFLTTAILSPASQSYSFESEATLTNPLVVAQTQPGSVGGTIGKSDKSTSGGADQTTSRHPVSKPTGSSCQKIIGTWVWHNPLITSEAVFNPDGSGTNSLGFTIRWKCSGELVIAKWSQGPTDHARISGDGNNLSVTTVDCGFSQPCKPGTFFRATRK